MPNTIPAGCAPSLYQEITARNIPHDSHESDLYLPHTPETLALVEAYGRSYSLFTSETPGPRKGTLWMDVAFAYEPWWERRRRG